MDVVALTWPRFTTILGVEEEVEEVGIFIYLHGYLSYEQVQGARRKRGINTTDILVSSLF